MSEKALVRGRVLTARSNLDPAVRAAHDAGLVAGAVALARGHRRVAAYAPMTGEPGGSALVTALADVVEAVLLPVLRPDRDLDWTAFAGDLGPRGPAGFRTPEGPRLGLDAISEASLVFVPALAVDPAGRRLGRGGGSYDRALARVSPGVPVIALLYSGEVLDEVPVDPHDRPVTAVLLPDGPESCGSPGWLG